MDISTPLIFVTLFIIASLSLFLVYKYGIKEKSYEEALAEQRQQTSALLGVKPKPKEKKNKKASKKLSKEKLILQENETDESENVEQSEHSGKLHVEFKEETEEVSAKEIVQAKTKRVKKVRPILVKTDKSPEKVILDVVDTPVINHFEENHPKDDFELLRSNSRDDMFKQDLPKEKVTKEKKGNQESAPTVKNNKKTSKLPPPVSNAVETTPAEVAEKKVAEEKKIEPVVTPAQSNGVVGNTGKEKKKKKSEFNTRQQLTADRDGLINSVRKAELSKNEVQLLIDLLLNKQLEAPAIVDDWSEGKSDPVQKLKKQLADKEKALAEEQEALAGAQAKLREIRAEQQAEKSQLQQKIRGFEEILQAKQIETQATNNRLQVNSQKIQQLQAELNAEILKNHKLIEDNQALQMQGQQFEVTMSQIQETEGIMVKLRGDVEELSAQNHQLRMELQQIGVEKEHHHQLLLQQSEHNRQLKEAHQEMERSLELAMRQESDWKMEISNLNTALQQQFEEKRRVELAVEQSKEDLRSATNEKLECAKIIAQLKSELQQLEEEQVSKVNGSSEENKAQEIKILNLNNELTSVKNELSSVQSKLQQTEKRYSTDLESSGKKVETVEKELEAQRAKNNKLAAEIRVIEQVSQKHFIERLFPEIEGLKGVSSEDWQAECGKLIKNYVASLKSQKTASADKDRDVDKLQAQLLHYKNVIDDTEGVLNKLQTHIETEELNWRTQLAAKESEIEHLKEVSLSQLQSKVSGLEKQLSSEISEKNRIIQECQLLKSQKPQSTKSDPTATIEKLSEEVNRLRELLSAEQTKNENLCLKAQTNCNNSNSTNGPALIERCLSSSSSRASSVVEEINKKPKCKKKKKKVPSLRNLNICPNMGCQFLYCDGNTCRGN